MIYSPQNIYATSFISKTAEWLTETLLVVWVLKAAQGDLWIVGWIYSIRFIPCLVLAPLGGWVADNANQRTIVIAVDAARGGALLAFTIALSEQSLPLELLVGLGMVMTFLDCLYAPCFRSYVASRAASDALLSINSNVHALEEVASILGPLVFSVTVVSVGVDFSIVVSGILFIAAAGIFYREPSPAKRTNLSTPTSSLRLFLSYKKRSNPLSGALWAMIGCTTVCAVFATAVVRFIMPAAVLEHFQADAYVGYVIAAVAGGTAVGAIVFGKLRLPVGPRDCMRYWALYGALMVLSALAIRAGTDLFILILIVTGFIGGWVDISIITGIQRLAPPDQLGRAFSIYYSTALIGDGISGLVAAAVFSIAGASTFMLMALCLAIAPVMYMARRVREN